MAGSDRCPDSWSLGRLKLPLYRLVVIGVAFYYLFGLVLTVESELNKVPCIFD